MPGFPAVQLIGADGATIGTAGAITTASGAGTNATQNTTNTAVPTNASNVTPKTTAGRLFGVTITAAGTNPLVISDGSGGTTIFAAAASAAIGYYPISGGNIFSTSLFVVGNAANPAIVCHYA